MCCDDRLHCVFTTGMSTDAETQSDLNNFLNLKCTYIFCTYFTVFIKCCKCLQPYSYLYSTRFRSVQYSYFRVSVCEYAEFP